MSPSPAASPPSLSSRLEQACLALLALILIAVPLFFYTYTQDQFELPKLILLRVLSSLLIGSALAWRALTPEARWRRTALDWPLLGFSAWLAVKTVSSVSPALSWRGEYENFAGSLTQLNYSLLFWLSAQFVSSWPRAKALGQAFLWAALAASAYALLQACQRDFVAWSSESYVSDRFFGPLGNPNFLAGLACMAIPLKLALAWDEQERPVQGRDWSWWGRIALLLSAVAVYLYVGHLDRLALVGERLGQDLAAKVVLTLWLLGIVASYALRRAHYQRGAQALGHGLDLLLLFKALANTGTRGGFLGLMVGLAALGAGWLRFRAQGASMSSLLKRLGVAALATVLLLSLAFMGLGSSFRTRMKMTLSDPAFAFEASRMQIWVPAIKIWRANPWTGTGVDTFKSVFPSYSTSRFSHFDGENVSSRMAHCEPLQVLATMGVIGLALWLAFCGALFRAWWRRLATAPEEPLLLLGLGGLLAAYLAQNLVSFGVSSISVPFFIAAALIFAGDPAPGRAADGVRAKAWRPVWALSLGLVIAGLGLWQASRNARADVDYALCSQINRQLGSVGQASLDDAQNMAGYAVQQLQSMPLPPEASDELNLWLPALVKASEQGRGKPAEQEQARQAMIQGGSALLYLVSALKMEEAVKLCPDEVKYQVYLGLSYEELFKRSQPQRRSLWFDKARQAYELSISMNPQNAYYQGNLGRLFGMGAEAGDALMLPQAEQHYQAAIRIAPVTRLFYENLLVLYARYARFKEAAVILDSLEARDKALAPSVLIAAASTFFQWRHNPSPAWDAAARKASLPLIVDWARRCVALAPRPFSDPRDQSSFADYSYTLAVFEDAAGMHKEARAALAQGLQWKPGDPDMLKYKKAQGY